MTLLAGALGAMLLVSGCSLVGTTGVDLGLTGFQAPPQAAPREETRPAPLATAPPTGTLDATEIRGKRRLRPKPRRGPFEMDLYHRSDHVPQYTGSWCVGASMQMMINMMEPGPPNRSVSFQRRLYKLARQVSPWVEERPGASTYGWAGGLERLGYGSFVEMASGSRQGALQIAARQMRLTRRPVGLLVWEGEHAWVMSGFKATADPAFTNKFRVTAVWIEDPWAGRHSSYWGRGLAPHSLVRVDNLRGFVRWESFHRPEYGRRGKFTIVTPV
jgi:hypothetical protein